MGNMGASNKSVIAVSISFCFLDTDYWPFSRYFLPDPREGLYKLWSQNQAESRGEE